MTAATEAALYNAWASSGASEKVLLALFEAGIVESGMRNLASRKVPESLKYPNEGVAPGDHDSVGVLQQRPGWGSVADRMNPSKSAQKFISAAKSKEKESGQTAGQLAQAVQVSAFPLKYDAVEGRAKILIASARKNGPPVTTTPVGIGDSMGNVIKVFQTLGDRNTWVRVGLFLGGFILAIYAFMKLTGDNKLSPVTKAVASAVVTRKL